MCMKAGQSCEVSAAGAYQLDGHTCNISSAFELPPHEWGAGCGCLLCERRLAVTAAALGLLWNAIAQLLELLGEKVSSD